MSTLDKILLNGTDYDLGGSGGISSVAQALLINILRNGIYESDQSTNITNLETELAQGGGGSRVAIVNNLTNCTNSNSAISVDIGASYVGTITADEGYEMDSITVLMGGVDVTSSVVAGDVITIASVSGTVSITAVAISTAESGLVTLSKGLNLSKSAVSLLNFLRKNLVKGLLNNSENQILILAEAAVISSIL